jgi:hypothetical protein
MHTKVIVHVGVMPAIYPVATTFPTPHYHPILDKLRAFWRRYSRGQSKGRPRANCSST